MPKFSGSFVGKVSSQAMATVKDVPNHELSLVQIIGPQTVSDPRWKDAVVSYYGMADLVSGSGPQTGYYMNQHPDGDTDYGTFKATISGNTLKGTWKSSGGTGAFKGMTGSGTFSGVMTSPTEVETKWEGSYQLGRGR
jgi:hypothetical protein